MICCICNRECISNVFILISSRVLVVFSFIITHMFGNSLLLLLMPSDFSYDVSGLHNVAFEVLTPVLQASCVHP